MIRSLRARLPPPTVRLRLTLVYGGLFLACGAALVALTYFLAQHAYTSHFFVSSGKLLGFGKTSLSVTPGNAIRVRAVGIVPSPAFPKPSPAQIIASAHAQSSAARSELLVDSGIALAIMAVLSIWLGWVIAGRALRPLRTITNAAREISASNLHRRLGLTGPDDELRQLGTTFDGLLERLEAAFEAQRQFVANASHELRTPLTLERTLLEVALADPAADVASLRATCAQVLAVGAQQERLIEALLTLSRSQRGLDQREPVDLAAIAAAATAAADREGLAFATSFAPARTTGDARLVERLAANLLGNAVCHNRPHGHVAVSTRSEGSHAVLAVANTGPAVPPDEVPRLFRPFQRLERGRTGEGIGLGLSIVDAVARAHGATVAARPGGDGGLEIEVAFPLAAS